MSVEMSKAKKLGYIIAISLSSFSVMANMAFNPIVDKIYELFGSNALTATAISGPDAVIIFVSLLTPIMLKYISKKQALIIGGICFSLTSIFGVAVLNVYYVVGMRLLNGIGMAILNVAAVSSVSEVFTDEDERSKVMGYYNGTMTVFGVITGIVAGNLAVARWQNAFYVYYFSLIFLVMFFLFVPHIKPEKTEKEVVVKAEKTTKEPLGKMFWLFITGFMLIGICNVSQLWYIAVYLDQNGIGNAALAGTLMSFVSFTSIPTGYFFGWIYKKVGDNLIWISYPLAIAAHLALWLVPSVTTLWCTCAAMGIAFGLMYSYVFAHLPAIVPQSRVDDAIGLSASFASCSGIITGYLVTFAMNMFGGVLNKVYAITAVIAVIGFACCLAAKPKKQNN